MVAGGFGIDTNDRGVFVKDFNYEMGTIGNVKKPVKMCILDWLLPCGLIKSLPMVRCERSLV